MATTYTFTDLIADVKKEATALRVHATEEERANLKIVSLMPRSRGGCIYGMMTGDCFSNRASLLIEKCCVRYFKNDSFTSIRLEGFKGIVKRVNGASVEGFAYERQQPSPAHYSAIEAYILLPEANNANLISYLRGETETLDL